LLQPFLVRFIPNPVYEIFHSAALFFANCFICAKASHHLERMKTPEKAKPTLHLEMPPGQPIGCDDDY
jgi:hypothetical protein